MSIFKRLFQYNKVKTLKVPELKILMVACVNGWSYYSAVFVLVKRDGSYFILIKVRDKEWSSQEQPNRQIGINRMNSLVQERPYNGGFFDWKPAVDCGLLNEPPDISYGNLTTYGYINFDLENYSNDIFSQSLDADFCFTVGRELDEAFDKGWLPASIEDYQIIEYYLRNAPLQAGYFGPFKNILKRLTNFCQNDENVNSNLLRVLGIAYGRVEAKTTNVRSSLFQSREDYDAWNLEFLVDLPGFTGSKHPSLKTLQYLARKGLRLHNYLLNSEHQNKVEYFELCVLAAANYWHNSKLSEDKYLSGQMLISSIIYRGSGLAIRDVGGRKMILDSKSKRHMYLAPGSLKKYDNNTSISASEIEFIAKMAINPDNPLANSAVMQYLFMLTKTNDLVFELNFDAIRLLAKSENPKIREMLIEYLILNPDKFAALPVELLDNFLEIGDKRVVNAILLAFERSMPNNYFWNSEEWKGQEALLQVARNWVDRHTLDPLDQDHLEIALRILVAVWPRDPYRDQERLITLLLRVMRDANISENQELLDLIGRFSVTRDWNNPFSNISAVFGITSNEKYPIGILDISDLSDTSLLTAYGSMLANSVNFIQAEVSAISVFLDSFFMSGKKGAFDLMAVLSQNPSLNSALAEALKQQLAKHDPTGSTYVKSLKLFVSNGSTSALLNLLTQLSEESYAQFWRRNEKELKVLFSGWEDTATFIWNNLDYIPLRTIEFICLVDNFDRKLLESLTPRTISRMSATQTEFFIEVMKRSQKIEVEESLIRSLIISPSSELNRIGAEFVKSNKLMDNFWLLMLESNLPVSVNIAASYLADCQAKKDFVPKILMALDSNNQTARKRALEVLADTRDVTTMKSVVSALLENRNPDTWKTVYDNIGLLDNESNIQAFTDHVFLSRRKARRDKELLKVVIDKLTEQIDDLISYRTLLRLSRSSIAADREWALKKIASSEQSGEEIIIEKTWG